MFYKKDRYNECCICGKSGVFVLEWYGLNQNGEKPEVVAELGACRSFRHMIEIIQGDLNLYSDSPNGVVDTKTLDIEHPSLTKLLDEAMKFRGNSRAIDEICRQGQEIIDKVPIPRQLMLWENDF